MTTRGSCLALRPRPAVQRVLVFILLAAMLLLPASALPITAQEWSAPRTVYVPVTGQTTDGYFLDVWRA